MPTVTLKCPYCLTDNTCFEVSNFKNVYKVRNMQKPKETTHEAIGECRSCKSFCVIFFKAIADSHTRIKDRFCNYINQLSTEINVLEAPGMNVFQMKLIGQTPRPSKALCPKHCPENVETAFLEAEKARITGLFSAASAGYRKTVDRAVTPLVRDLQGYNDHSTLGKKLKLIKDNELFPKIMIEWISIVSKNGNFSLHDDDKDYSEEEEISPSQKFTRALLEYLYTLPDEVNKEFKIIHDRENNEDKAKK